MSLNPGAPEEDVHLYLRRLTMSAAAAVLLGVAVLSSWLPARRATGVDPTVALRAE